MKKRGRKKTAQKREPESYIKRDYRLVAMEKDLVSSRVRVEETDLHILAEGLAGGLAGGDVTALSRELVIHARLQLENYIQKNPVFVSSLIPLPMDPTAPPLIREMLQAGQDAQVGPMAAVAGVIARYVGEGLIAAGFKEVIVENGGDIFLRRSGDCTVAIFAGQSPLSYNIGIRIKGEHMPCGVCTSSGTVGHSLSFGDADSVTVVADSVALADAAATRLGNEVGRGRGSKTGVNMALAQAKTIQGLRGVLIICNEVMGAVGDLELVRL